MAKLYFKYGAMGSSKTAQALITKFNYEERGMAVWLLKPAIDSRDGKDVIRSRIGLEETADVLPGDADVYEMYKNREKAEKTDVIIVDECQFLAEEQIDQLRNIVNDFDIAVLCFGLRTDFRTKLFPGSRRLFEVADSFSEIKTMCACGSKATVNARIDENGRVITDGDQILIGGNDRYIAMCHRCWKKSCSN